MKYLTSWWSNNEVFRTLCAVLVLSSVVADNEIEPTIALKIKDGHIFVYDKVIHPKVLKGFKDYIKHASVWKYTYPDKYDGREEEPNSGNLHWQTPLSPTKFSKGRLWKPLKKLVETIPESIKKGREYLPYSVLGTMLARGDFTIPFAGATTCEDKIFMRVFLNSDISKHDYCDQTFYSEDGEIITSIFPKFGRVVVWTGDVKTLMRPPSMGRLQPEYSLLLKLTSDVKLADAAKLTHESIEEEMANKKKAPFPYTNASDVIPDNLDVSNHVMRKFFDRHGNVVAVFDNLFTKEIVDTTRHYMMNFESSFQEQPHDPASSETHDNVKFIAGYSPNVVLPTPYWKVIDKLTAYLTNETEWYPYDVACNLILHSHHTRIHEDCTNNEFEFTFLMYLNPGWTENMYGETSFYQLSEEQYKYDEENLQRIAGKGIEKYDFVGAVIPKFGRVAIFRNLVPHSARPPSPDFLGARFTFPVKVSRTKNLARAKVLREALDYKTDDLPDDPRYDPLKEGAYHLATEDMEWTEREIAKMLKAKEEGDMEHKMELERFLFPQRKAGMS